jgi:hypothetical protein
MVCSPAFGPVADSLRRLLTSYGGGGAVAVYHQGECVVDIWVAKDREVLPATRHDVAELLRG